MANVQAAVAVPAKSKVAATKPATSAKPKVTLVDPKKEDSDDSEGSDEDGDDEVNFVCFFYWIEHMGERAFLLVAT